MTSHRRFGSLSMVACSLVAALAGSSLSSCSAPPSASDGYEPTGALRGELEIISVLQAPGPDGLLAGRSLPADGRQHYLRVDGAPDRVRLRFDGDPDLVPGTRLRVWGTKQTDGFRVTGHELLEDSARNGSIGEALVGQPATNRSIAIAVVNVSGSGTDLSTAEMNRIFTSRTNTGPLFDDKAPGLSMFQYYDQTSYGMLRPTGDVFGPYNYSGDPCIPGSDALSRAIKPMVPGKFDHYIFFYGKEQPGCGAGWANEGTYGKPSTDVWLNHITFASGPAEEINHNLGYLHSSNITSCPGGITVPMPDNLSACTLDEYGNMLSVMGQGSSDEPAFEKWYAHWLSGCNAVRVKSTATFTMVPLETQCNGIQVLQVPMAKPRTFTTPQSGGKASAANFFYLEFRTNIGMDSMGKSSYLPITLNPGIYVHISDEIQPQTKTCARGVLLDMNPATKSPVDGVGAGQTYTEPGGGISFKVDALDARSATVTVTIPNGTGMNLCDDGTPIVAPGPGPESCGGIVMVGPDGGVADSGVQPPPPSDAGRGGAGGSTGRTDAGNAGGSAGGGAGGSRPDAGTGNAGGSGGGSAGGNVGSGGTVGSGGNVGSGGSVGPGGSVGSGGSMGSGGTAVGVGGGSGSSTTTGNHPKDPDNLGGCSCRMGAHDSGSANAGWLALGAAAAVSRMRRRRRTG